MLRPRCFSSFFSASPMGFLQIRQAWHTWRGYDPLDEDLPSPKARESPTGSYALIVLSVLGIALSIIMIYEYFHAAQKSFCDLTASVSCSQLILLGWATLLHVPIACFGLTWFITLLTLQYLVVSSVGSGYALLVLLWAISGALFVVYLVSVEIIVGIMCPMCTVVHIVDAIILVLAFLQFWVLNGRPARWEIPTLVKQQLPKVLPRSRALVGLLLTLNLLPLIPFNIVWLFTARPDGGLSERAKAHLARCLTREHAVLYTKTTCPHCTLQKSLFGSALPILDVVVCDLPAGQQRCTDNAIQWYPTWVMYNDNGHEAKRLVGEFSLEHIAKWGGCEAK